jgi:hypothetical protein
MSHSNKKVFVGLLFESKKGFPEKANGFLPK